MENNFCIRANVLLWMQNLKAFTMDDLLEFLQSTPMQQRVQYINIVIELLDSPLIISMYNLYKLCICM